MVGLTRRSFALAAGGAFAGFVVDGVIPARGVAAVDLSKVTLRVGDQTGATQSKLGAAGLLDDVPYKIDWSVYAAAVNLHEALKADAVDIGAANDSPTVSAIAGGSKIAAVAAWRNNGRGSIIVVRKDSPLRSVADLRGKTISPTTRGSVAHYLVVGELKRAGLGLDDVKLAFLSPGDASAAFLTGNIDAWGTWGTYAARAQGTFGARVLTDGAGVNSGLFVLSATRTALLDPGKVAAIADFCRRVDRGYDWTRAHRDEHVAWFARFARQDAETSARLYGDEATYQRIPIDDRFVARLKQTFDTWVSVGVLSGTIDFNDYVYRDLPGA